MAEPVDMILPILKEIRADIAALQRRMDDRFDAVDKRFDAVEKKQESFTRALSADSLMTRLLTGEFEERIENLEKYRARIESLEERVKAFEGHT